MTLISEKKAVRITGKTKDAFRKMRYLNRIHYEKIDGQWFYDFQTVYRLAQFKTVPALREWNLLSGDKQNIRRRVGHLPKFMIWQPHSRVVYLPPSVVDRVKKRYPDKIV